MVKKAGSLVAGESFSMDLGESWHTVQSVVKLSPKTVHVLCTDEYEDEMSVNDPVEIL